MEKVADKAVPTTPAAGFDKERVGKAIGRIASGVFIMTTQDERGRDGIMASWVSQAAFDPPMLTVAVQKQRHVLEFLKSGSIRCLPGMIRWLRLSPRSGKILPSLSSRVVLIRMVIRG